MIQVIWHKGSTIHWAQGVRAMIRSGTTQALHNRMECDVFQQPPPRVSLRQQVDDFAVEVSKQDERQLTVGVPEIHRATLPNGMDVAVVLGILPPKRTMHEYKFVLCFAREIQDVLINKRVWNEAARRAEAGMMITYLLHNGEQATAIDPVIVGQCAVHRLPMNSVREHWTITHIQSGLSPLPSSWTLENQQWAVMLAEIWQAQGFDFDTWFATKHVPDADWGRFCTVFETFFNTKLSAKMRKAKRVR